MRKIKVAYVCVHNSCRSQMAEALTKHFASDVFEAYSAGTHTKPQINQDAVRVIKQLYHLDMNLNHYSKTLDKIPPVDIVITMGCNVECPFVPNQFREDWGLEDPSGQPDSVFIETAKIIEGKIRELKERVQSGKIVIK